MNVREIIEKYIKDNGYDGLVSEFADCGCSIDDLAPCDCEDFILCEPGYKVKCDPENCQAGGGCEFHIATEKAVKISEV